MLSAHGRLAGNSLFVRCHVTMNQPMKARVVLKKPPVIKQYGISFFDQLTLRSTNIKQGKSPPKDAVPL